MEGFTEEEALRIRDTHISDTLDPSVLTLTVSNAANIIDAQDGNGNGHGLPDSDIESLDGHKTVQPAIKHETPDKVLKYASLPSGLVYDVRMRFHVEPIPRDHDMHPEDPRRIFEVYNELLQAGLVADPTEPSLAGERLLKRIDARFATEREILRLHTKESYDFVMSLEDFDDETLYTKGEEMDSVYLSVNTPKCALLAAGGAIEAARAVMNGQVKNSVAVIRPPGHHAEHDRPMGFCFFNNVPVAVRACQDEFGDRARKILILDWDVHHGNGVQNMFYDDPNVLYISLHVSINGAFYPLGDDKDHLHCGQGVGLGKNVNIPWKTAGMGDGDYLYAFQQVVMPIAQDFDPDMVFICAGFDAAEGDMIGSCHVTPAGFAHMTHMLMSLADGKLVVCLEGGYNLRSIAVSALAVTRTLMGEQPARLQSTQPSPTGVETVQLVLRQQSKFWPCLFPQDSSRLLETTKAERMHDVIREWQSTTLFHSHKMVPLFIARTELSRSYHHQVIATEARPLLLIFHDPPELMGVPDPRTSKLEAHNTWLTDGVKSYIEWAAEKGFSVIDVNVPLHYTGAESVHDPADPLTVEERAAEAEDLATYIWENYVELSSATQIYIMGIGASYTALINLIKQNPTTLPDRITKLFIFISDHSLVSCRSSEHTDLASWYVRTSRIYVPTEHGIWDVVGQREMERGEQLSVAQRKARRKFGTLVESDKACVADMLVEHFGHVTREIESLLDDGEGSDTDGDGNGGGGGGGGEEGVVRGLAGDTLMQG